MPEVRSTVRIDMAGNIQDGLKAVAKQADSAAQAVSKLNQTAGTGGGPGSPSGIGPGYNQSILQAEAARRMSDQQLNAYMAQHKAAEERRKSESEAAKLRQEVQHASLMRQSGMQSLATAGLSLSGAGGAVGGYGQGLAIGSALEAMGHTRLARFAGPAGLAIGGAHQVAETAIDYMKATYNPYLTQEQKERMLAESIPGGKFALNLTSDTYRRRESDLERAGENFQRARLSQERDFLLRDDKRNYIERSDVATDRLASIQRNQLPIMQSFDRSTASGQWSAAEEQIRIRSRRELTKAVQEQGAAESKVTANMERQRSIAEEEAKIRKELTKWNAQLTGGTDDSRQFARNEVNYFADKLAENATKMRESKIAGAGLQTEFNETKQRTGRARLADRESEAEVLQKRIEFGSSSASRLATAGIGGRIINREMFKIVQQMGIENASPEMIAQAEQYAPTTIRNMAEQAGTKLVTDEDMNLAPDDFKFTRNVNEMRKKQDELKIENQKEEQIITESAAEYGIKISDALEKLTGTIIQTIESERMKLEANIRTAGIP